MANFAPRRGEKKEKKEEKEVSVELSALPTFRNLNVV